MNEVVVGATQQQQQGFGRVVHGKRREEKVVWRMREGVLLSLLFSCPSLVSGVRNW